MEEKIIRRKIEEEIKSSYLDYAMSVIIGRAIPDVRDGLKPVHRRILYSMSELNLMPDRPYRKSATVIGDVLGKYHPHGDASVYDALVRLAQNFSMREVLVDGHGNFGSIDGDPPAAYRYTEVRLAPISLEFLDDLHKETVDFVPNFDNSRKEPVVLPVKFPNLLVNGSSGIAVGMATNIPPHNLSEVVDGLIMLIDNPDVEVEELMKVIKGPDFPTGGYIMGTDGIKQAYSTGQGSITIRGKYEKIDDNGKKKIIITELPYQVNKAALIEKIAELMREKKVQGISALRDESDRSGMSVVIELKKDADMDAVLNCLCKYTQLQINFGIIMLAISDGKPELLSLKRALELYLEARKEVVTRRCRFDLKKAQERAHILEGLKIALDNIDEIISIIRKSPTVEVAKQSLIKTFSLTETQSQTILDMRLARLTALERKKIDEEYKEVIKTIGYLEDILASPKKILEVIKEELKEIKEKYGNPRRTIITEKSGDIETEETIPLEDVIITLTKDGYIKRLPRDIYRTQRRGGKGVTALTTKEEDYVYSIICTTSHHFCLFFTNKGLVYRLKSWEIPVFSRQARGTAIVNLIQLAPDEYVTAVIPVDKFEENEYLFMATRYGIVKKTSLSEFENIHRTGKIAISLSENDELRWVGKTKGKDEIILATKFGNSIRFKETDVRCMGRTAQGVIGIRMRKKGDEVVGMAIAEKGKDLLVISENGYGKRTPISKFRLQKRGGSGIKAMKIVKKNGYVVSIKIVEVGDEVVLASSNGIIIRMEVKDIPSQGRSTQGVRLMRLEKDDKVVAVESFSFADEADE